MSAEVQVLPRRVRLSGAAVVEEVEWLLSFGMHRERVAEALGMTFEALDRALSRHGRDDLAARLRERVA